MGLSLRWHVSFLFGCFCAYALWAGSARSEPLPAGSKDSPPGSPRASNTPQSSEVQAGTNYIIVPGPLRSFLRMGGISKKAEPDEVLPLLGHFVETYGYEGSREKSPKPTEALILFKRYFAQANALASVAGPDATLHFSTCEESKPLLAILGYRLKDGCGHNPSIEVDDPEKAFVTVDSGFPLVDMEQALFQGKPFGVPYPSVRLPLIYTKRDWTGRENSKDTDVIDSLANHAALSRLYWGLSRVDEETRYQLRKSVGMATMLSVASVVDFYGSSLAVRQGRVAVPGGTHADAAWKRLVGADPGHPGEFIIRLLQKDNGWLAEYYDCIARAPLPQLAYLTSGDHLQRFYAAFHGDDSSAGAVRSVFRPSANLLLLVTRLPLADNGEPLVPGDLSIWKNAFRRKSTSKIEAKWAEQTSAWTTPDQLVQGLFALSRSNVTDGPLDMYMSLSEIDRRRPAGGHISADTARLLMTHFSKLHDQYEMFSEFGLNDASIAQFVKMTQKIDQVRDPLLRGDMMGIFEANIGLWQILARQGQIPSADLNDSWRQMIDPFRAVSNSSQLFEAGRASLAELMKTATGKREITQEKIIALLAGPEQSTSDGRQVHARLAAEIREVLTDQRLISLDTLLELGDDFAKMAQNSKEFDAPRASELAEELEEARSPRAMFTEAERAEWTPGHEPNRHILLEMKTDLKKLLSRSAQTSESAGCGALTPFLRDMLVGLNYAYYQPPGAQILHSSPLLVRAHDFVASETIGDSGAWLAPQLFGVGQTAANGTHLSGSLAGLPYALAGIEQDFIVPENVQALIWQETTADLLMSSVVPRWWSTSREALHAAALYQKAGEELIAGAAKDANLRMAVTDILSNRLPPETMDQVNQRLDEGPAVEVLDRIAPADAFYLAVAFETQFPGRMVACGPAATELENLIQRDPEQVNPERLSQDFGVPHPTLAQSYRDEMLNLKPFPSVMNYASELLAESWESTNLYWARLADEMGYSPVMLNELAPLLTRRMVEKIFGSDFDDWQALIRAMRETGDEFRRRAKVNAAASHPFAPAK
jgi:hypothetical protein